MLDVGKGLLGRAYTYLDSYENEDNNNNNKQQPMYRSKDFNIIRKKIDKMYPEQPDISDYTKVSSYISSKHDYHNSDLYPLLTIIPIHIVTKWRLIYQ